MVDIIILTAILSLAMLIFAFLKKEQDPNIILVTATTTRQVQELVYSFDLMAAGMAETAQAFSDFSDIMFAFADEFKDSPKGE